VNIFLGTGKSVGGVVIGPKDVVITGNPLNKFHVRSVVSSQPLAMVCVKSMQGSTEIWNSIIGKGWQKFRIHNPS